MYSPTACEELHTLLNRGSVTSVDVAVTDADDIVAAFADALDAAGVGG
jgi:hypothetical protein